MVVVVVVPPVRPPVRCRRRRRRRPFSVVVVDPIFRPSFQVLEWAISGAIKIQDFFYPVGSVAGSTKAAQLMTWEFYKENFAKISAMLGTSPSGKGG